MHIRQKFKQISLVSGDENKLKQLFINLIMNAWEAVLEDGLIELELDEDFANKTVSVIVRDDGCGILNQDRDKNLFPSIQRKWRE